MNEETNKVDVAKPDIVLPYADESYLDKEVGQKLHPKTMNGDEATTDIKKLADEGKSEDDIGNEAKRNGQEDNWVVGELATKLGHGEEGLGKLRQEFDQLAEKEDEAARSTAKPADELDVRRPDEDGNLNKEELGKLSQGLNDELDEHEVKLSTHDQQFQRTDEAGKWPVIYSPKVGGGMNEIYRSSKYGKSLAGTYLDPRDNTDKEAPRRQRLELDQFIKSGKGFESEATEIGVWPLEGDDVTEEQSPGEVANLQRS
ncbi:hypothetical protein MMC29_006562 [Sticta canariensis]|nr:hypothetical protein [Sticta canariensis]